MINTFSSNRRHPHLKGFSLVELMVTLAMFGMVAFGALQLFSVFREQANNIELIQQGEADADLVQLLANTAITDEKSGDVCNVYTSQELQCNDFGTNSDANGNRDRACLVFRDITNFNVWGCDLGDGHVEAQFPDASDDAQDMTVAFWFKDTGCTAQYGCTLFVMGHGDLSTYTSNNGYEERLLTVTLNGSPDATDANCSGSNKIQLSLKYWDSGGDRSAVYYECFSHVTDSVGAEGSWTHMAFVISAATGGNYEFSNDDDEVPDDDEHMDSVKIFVNGTPLKLLTNYADKSSDGLLFEDGFGGAFWFLERRPDTQAYPSLKGSLGPVQVFNEAKSDGEIVGLYNRVFTADEADFEISMHQRDYDWGSEIFGQTHDADTDSNSGIVIKSEPTLNCGSNSEAAVRLCGVALEDNYDDFFSDSIIPNERGRAIMFAREPFDPTATDADHEEWKKTPWALFQTKPGITLSRSIAIDGEVSNYCLTNDSGSSPYSGGTYANSTAVDPEETDRWDRLTDYKFFPGIDANGDNVFFDRVSGGLESPRYQLRVSSEYKDQSGLSTGSQLKLARRFEDNQFCQLAPESLNFNATQGDDCDLSEATVTITSNHNPSVDQLYFAIDDYINNDNLTCNDDGGDCDLTSSSSDFPNCPSGDLSVVDIPFGESTSVFACRRNTSSGSGTEWSKFYIYRDIDFMPDGSRAVYNGKTGTLSISSSQSVSDARWPEILKLVRYRISDQQNKSAAMSAQYQRTRQMTFAIGDALAYYPPRALSDSNNENGTEAPHFYKFIPNENDSDPIDWTQSETAAEGSTYCGLQGYLATITSREENDFIFSRFIQDDGSPLAGWIGGSDADNEGEWKWRGGPEDGVIFTRHFSASGGNKTYGTTRFVYVDSNNTDSTVTTCGDVPGSLPSAVSGYPKHPTPSGLVESWDPFPDNNKNFCYTRPGSDCTQATIFQNWPGATNNGTTSSHNGGGSSDGSCLDHFVQPDNSNDEDYLQITGDQYGMGLWNDLPNTRTNSDDAMARQYNVNGYYAEFGGMTDDPSVTLSSEDVAVDISFIREFCAMP
ncbi:prepilin-type N-terminal cleavage/methylation domain-containing protein [Litoricolaceae bacterium]|nr:prepilin-type N-terminal cleavage/methylation domain-containing protein [Litorivicinaceae bacterium]